MAKKSLEHCLNPSSAEDVPSRFLYVLLAILTHARSRPCVGAPFVVVSL